MKIAKRYGTQTISKRAMTYGILFGLVQIAGFIFFYLYPFVISVIKAAAMGTERFSQMFDSEAFRLALWNTFKFMLIGLPLLYLFILLMALCMNRMYRRRSRGRGIFLALHLVPMLVPSAVVAFFIQIFFEKYGIINGILVHIHNNGIDWLHTSYVFAVFILIYLWKNYGYCMIIMMGGLSSVAEETIEAAKIEGASGWTILMKIILPQMKSYTVFSLIMGIVGIFKVFRESYMMFGDYPHRSIYMMQNFMNNCFYTLNYGRLAAASVIMIAILAVIVIAMLFRGNEWRRSI